MLLAMRMAKALQKCGVKVVGYEESKDPKLMDGEVTLESSLSVQVGYDYACLCIIKENGIDYLLEAENITNEYVFAKEVAKFMKTGQS